MAQDTTRHQPVVFNIDGEPYALRIGHVLIVDAVDEDKTVEDDQLERATCADQALIDSIARIDDRFIVLLNPFSILSDIAQTA